jgi:hypothetical protein
MKYDDASWHYGGDFPDNLPFEAGATHIAMFVVWCLINGLAGEMHLEEYPENYAKLMNRELTPGQWFIKSCDQKFTDEDLSEEGNAFTISYYQSDLYGSDYNTVLGHNVETIYHVSDSWEVFELIAPVIKSRFEEWKIQSNL